MVSIINISMGKENKTKKKTYLSYVSFTISKHFNLFSFIALHCVDLAKMASDTQDWGLLPQGAKTCSGGTHLFIYLLFHLNNLH